jgi:hypothetical protein
MNEKRFEIYEKYYKQSIPYFIAGCSVAFLFGVALGWLFL